MTKLIMLWQVSPQPSPTAPNKIPCIKHENYVVNETEIVNKNHTLRLPLGITQELGVQECNTEKSPTTKLGKYEGKQFIYKDLCNRGCDPLLLLFCNSWKYWQSIDTCNIYYLVKIGSNLLLQRKVESWTSTFKYTIIKTFTIKTFKYFVGTASNMHRLHELSKHKMSNKRRGYEQRVFSYEIQDRCNLIGVKWSVNFSWKPN